jgi:AraC-like DNA-binding protein
MTIRGANLRRLLRARDMARANFDADVRVIDLAREAGLSRAHFLRSFAQAFGVSPHEYVVQLRIDEARRALARGASVTDTCMAVGFTSLGSFSRLFAERVGESPRAWQRRVRTLVPSSELWPQVWIPGCFLTGPINATGGPFEHFSRSA